MPAPTQTWTPQHESALTGLAGLGISKKEARKYLEALATADPGELMRSVLRARTDAMAGAPPTPRPGAPTGAVPIVPSTPQTPAAAQTQEAGQYKAPGPSRYPTVMPPIRLGLLTNPMPPVSFADLPGRRAQPPASPPLRAAAPASPTINLRGFTPQQKTPAAAALAPTPPPAPEQKPLMTTFAPGGGAGGAKPRVRVRAAGQRLPPAPIGEPPIGAPPTPTETQEKPSKEAASASKTPVMISTKKEYDELDPGTEFLWPDGHIYEKPAT